ncbi:thioredoxin-like protein [Cytophaga hutchinsonii ATCC 33406]|uniref:Thioredoxin-like protein n=2 Tax=Cytophaga hutchinsonii TaxID=985 RepID=A0A6N4SSF8_CYTH3|nr:thioredoxin-like protein [Cytophaga hutchinsonii ATCC 33406]
MYMLNRRSTMTYLYSLLIFLFSFNITDQASDAIEQITMEQLQAKTIHPENDTLYIVNFWATWCGPCVAELPYFELAAKENADQKVKILLISLDFISEKAKVEAFIKKKNILNQVYLFNAGDPNKWINQIDTSWDGAIPATVFYKAGKKVFFHEGDLTQTELNEKIKTFKN